MNAAFGTRESAVETRRRRIADDESDPVGPLWNAAQVFRLLSVLYALGFQIAINGDLLHPATTWALFGGLVSSSVLFAVAYLVGFGRNWYWIVTELVVTCALLMSTWLVASDEWVTNNQTWPTTLWATNVVISAAILAGPVAGGVFAVISGGTSLFVKGTVSFNFGRNATLIVLLAVGVVVGLAAVSARRSHRALVVAMRLTAATEERERLSREVHDSVLQVLALIAKRGREIGGSTAELATLASEQERTLRQLLAATEIDLPAEVVAADRADLGALIRAHAAERVSVSAPPDSVIVDATVAAEIDAAVTNVLDNVVKHAGEQARAFVLVENLGEQVVVSIRDDGVGIPEGRLAQAQRQGRLGVAQSIVKRIESLGGTAVLDSGPGIGTEWELTVPLQVDRRM
ncbi:putative two-component histidine kinase [Gordonia effusa NBRC 100432]|uniref:histidine kinase n=1 Tax=Gordonia effusa NBRC 100432 TaxID=1077974 RepID=H0QW00_9ACTN|nr:ATP-binding protein [Gordonia effusa]GAB17001.1 putative two-component histidine kinase [Gordonia effusa NBRC 100432]